MGFSQDKNGKSGLASRAVTLTLLLVALVFAVIYIISLNSSLGWFANSPYTTVRNMNLAAATDQYDILIERTTEYDSLLAGNPKYNNVAALKTKFASPGYNYSFTDTSTATARKLAYELQNEVATRQEGVDYYYLTPGSCGTITFFLRPKAGVGDLTADFTISLGCLYHEYSGEDLVLTEVDNQAVLDLLKGHILFFTERTGANPNNYKYNGLIEDGTFSYDTSQHEKSTSPGKTDCYEITLFWEWPLTYFSITESISETLWGDRYPAELDDYVSDNHGYFFATNQGSSDPNDLYDGYNDGDQTIGEHANFIAVYIEPQ